MKTRIIALLFILLGLLVSWADEKKEHGKITGFLDFEEHLNQVDLCEVLNIHYDDFEKFMQEKGIKISTPGEIKRSQSRYGQSIKTRH